MKSKLSLSEKFASGGMLDLDEFCAWASIGRVSAYREAKEGRLKFTKVGRSTRITAEDAVAYRNSLGASAR